MLSNLVVGHQKFVLFVDDVGVERNSNKIIQKVLDEQNVKFQYFPAQDLNDELVFPEPTVLILKPFSKLELDYSCSRIFELILKLKHTKNVKQIFGFATIKNTSSRILIPFLEHMSDLVVNIKTDKVLSILTKKRLGSVKLKEYQHELLINKTGIKEIKQEKKQIIEEEPKINPETIGTFKIGQFKANELEAKKNLKLPFELM